MKPFLPLITLLLIFSSPIFAQTEEQPRIIAGSALCIEVKTGRVLYAKNIEEQRPVASTQKLLTALIIAENGGLDESVLVAATDMKIEPRNLWITTGSKYKRGKLLEMMLVRSYNDVTKCLARDHAGSQSAFAAKMNIKAKELGMKNSNFVNPHGLTAPGQYSTALDMMRLAQFAYANPEIRKMSNIKETTFTYHGGKTVPVKNSNELLFSYPECIGMKTGYTKASGRCLVCAAERNGQTVLAVILGSTMEAIWRDSKTVLDHSLNTLERGVDLEKYKASASQWVEQMTAIDQLNQTEEHTPESILFIGTSNIHKWDLIEDDMAPYKPIQRGLGGGDLGDLAVYAKQLVSPHQFRAAVLYSGNDITGQSDDLKVDEAANLFRFVCNKISSHNSKAPIYYVATNPSVSNHELWDSKKELNSKIKSVCDELPNVFFIGTESIFLDKDGNPREDLFNEDGFDLNDQGYKLLSAAIKTHLDGRFNGAFKPVLRGWQMPPSEY